MGSTNETFYARLFILAVVLFFAWMLWRRKRRYRFKPIKRYRLDDGDTSAFEKYLDRYASSVVQNGRSAFRDKLDNVTSTFGLPSLANAGIDVSSSFGDTATHTHNDGSANRSTRPQTSNKTEEECRAILERIFNSRFDSVRPDFLKNPKTGRNLEMDCYNEQLKLALEYNGQQHYRYTPYFHRTKANFYSQVHRDDWKRREMKRNGLTVIEVPYWIRSANLEDYIRKQLRRNGYKV